MENNLPILKKEKMENVFDRNMVEFEIRSKELNKSEIADEWIPNHQDILKFKTDLFAEFVQVMGEKAKKIHQGHYQKPNLLSDLEEQKKWPKNLISLNTLGKLDKRIKDISKFMKLYENKKDGKRYKRAQHEFYAIQGRRFLELFKHENLSILYFAKRDELFMIGGYQSQEEHLKHIYKLYCLGYQYRLQVDEYRKQMKQINQIKIV